MNIQLKWLSALLAMVCIPVGVVNGQGKTDTPDFATLDWLKSKEENSVEGIFKIHDLENTATLTKMIWRLSRHAIKHVKGLSGYSGKELCNSLNSIGDNDEESDRDLRYIAVVKRDKETLKGRSLTLVQAKPTLNTIRSACQNLDRDLLPDEWYFAIRRRFPGIKLSYKKFWTTDKSVKTALRAGWAYVGVKPADDQWRTKYFNWDGDPEPPKKGDTLRATGSVNLRADYIRFHANIRRWVNAEKVGLIRKGDRLKVLSDPKNVDDDFYWVRGVPVD